MQLHADRLTLFGVGWTGFYRRTVSLGDIAEVMWWTGAADREVNLAFLLHSGERLGVRVRKKAGLWKYEVEARAPRLRPSEETQPPASIEKKEAA